MEKINIQLPQYWKKKKLNPEFIKNLNQLQKAIRLQKMSSGNIGLVHFFMVALLSKLK